ncbi:MAG: hypothetical protein ACI9PP_000138 [Halobacteriales archaeon]|jgi:hypothetical protein
MSGRRLGYPSVPIKSKGIIRVGVSTKTTGHPDIETYNGALTTGDKLNDIPNIAQPRVF